MSTWENEKKCGGNLQQLNFTQVDAGVAFAEEGRGKQKKSVGERQKVRKRNPELHFFGAPSPPLPQTVLRRMDEDFFWKRKSELLWLHLSFVWGSRGQAGGVQS